MPDTYRRQQVSVDADGSARRAASRGAQDAECYKQATIVGKTADNTCDGRLACRVAYTSLSSTAAETKYTVECRYPVPADGRSRIAFRHTRHRDSLRELFLIDGVRSHGEMWRIYTHTMQLLVRLHAVNFLA